MGHLNTAADNVTADPPEGTLTAPPTPAVSIYPPPPLQPMLDLGGLIGALVPGGRGATTNNEPALIQIINVLLGMLREERLVIAELRARIEKLESRKREPTPRAPTPTPAFTGIDLLNKAPPLSPNTTASPPALPRP